MKKVYYEWDSVNSCYLFWHDGDAKDDGWHVAEDQFNNQVEKLEGQGYIVEEFDE